MKGGLLFTLVVAFSILLSTGGDAHAASIDTVAAHVFNELDLRRAVVFASGIIYWGGVLIQARRIRRKIGRTPNLRPKGTKERILWLGWTFVVLTWIIQPLLISAEKSLGPLELFSASINPATLIPGIVLILSGYLATLWCYAAMGSAWRIGIDREGSSSLVQAGPYRRMRHPIYSFQMVMLIGAALLLPTPVSLTILFLHFICALVKARDEENHLINLHGNAYRDYMKRSGRFFPKFW